MCTCMFYSLHMEYHKNTCSTYDGGSLVYCILMILLCSYVAVCYINCDMNYVSCCMKLLALAIHNWTYLNIVHCCFLCAFSIRAVWPMMCFMTLSCVCFFLVQVSWVLCSGYQVIPRGEWPVCGIKHPLSSKADVKKKEVYTSHSLPCLHGKLQE
jgi:hypothetical protein